MDQPPPLPANSTCPHCGYWIAEEVKECPFCRGHGGADEDSGPILRDGQMFGRYRIVRHLATGGMGSVYRAFDPVARKDIAIKVIPAGFLDAELSMRFVDEAVLAARIAHPNVIRIYDVGMEGEIPYYTMDLVEGVSLAEELDLLALRDVVRVLRDISSALGAAHRQGIVHRDVKPSNIFLDVQGNVFLSDFGVARFAGLAAGPDARGTFPKDADLFVTEPGMQIGTPKYMSPEQVEADSKLIGPEADVWAIGVILYEALAGQPPFHSLEVDDLFEEILHSDLQPPSSLPYPAHVAPDLEAIAMRCLQREPEKRYRNGDALADVLGQWLASQPATGKS
jgi:serine/threonine-protein kinase